LESLQEKGLLRMTTEELPLIETITPADQAAVAEAVRNAGEKGLAVYPVGGGTMIEGGINPKQPGIALSLANLNRTIDYPAADMTITVEAGMTIAELNRQLAANHQRLPIDVAQPDRATVGGAVAVNTSGPRRYAYGSMRDYVLGLTAVDGQGTLFNAGGRVVKNAAGYNVCRLMTGSFGSLGVITQVTLMVRPQCEASVFLVCEVPDFKIAEKLLADLVSLPIQPVAVDFVAGRQQENDLDLGPMLIGSVGRFYVGFEGTTIDVDWMVEQLRHNWIAAGATEPILIPTSRAESLWNWLTEFPADVQIKVLPSAVIETIAKTLEIDPNCAIRAHAGDGVIRVKVAEGRGERGEEREEGRGLGTSVPSALPTKSQNPKIPKSQTFSPTSILERLRELTTAMGGKMIVQKPADGMTPGDIWGPPGPEFHILQALKERFDPKNILNPGRFVF
jgi:glycolate oxidase FAD binding subunit